MHDILVAPFCRMVDTLLQSPLEMRYGFGTTPKPHFGAQVVASPLTRPAVVTGHADFQCNPLANLVTSDILPDGDYDPGRLVA
jgi:hypothetical protein